MKTSSSSTSSAHNDDRVELEVLECHEDHSSDMDEERTSCANHHKKYSRGGRRVKLKTQSCGSLCSLTSLKKSASSVKSEPNVRYEIDDDVVNINIGHHENECYDERPCEEYVKNPTGAVNKEFSTNTSGPTGDNRTNDESIRSGCKASILDFLSRFGLWRGSDCNQTIVPPQRASKLPPEKGPPSHARRLRGSSCAGKILKFIKFSLNAYLC